MRIGEATRSIFAILIVTFGVALVAIQEAYSSSSPNESQFWVTLAGVAGVPILWVLLVYSRAHSPLVALVKIANRLGRALLPRARDRVGIILALLILSWGIASWIRSATYYDGVTWRATEKLCVYLESSNTMIAMGAHYDAGPLLICQTGWESGTSRSSEGPRFRMESIGVLSKTPSQMKGIAVAFPYWLPVVVGSFAAGFQLVIGYRRCRRCKTPRYKGCDYDLTGNVSGVCPECGTTIDKNTRDLCASDGDE